MHPELFPEENIRTRINYTTEKEIDRMKGKIARFQRKLSHLQDIYEHTKPISSKPLAIQLDLMAN